MARGDRPGIEGLVFWLVVFAFFAPPLAIKLADSINRVMVTLAPFVGVFALVGVGFYVMQTRRF